MGERSQKVKVDRGPARVELLAEFFKDGAYQRLSLPAAIGVIEDLYGNANDDKPAFEERKAFAIESEDEFFTLLKETKPRISISVKDCVSGDQPGAEQDVVMEFTSLEGMKPYGIPKAMAGDSELGRRIARMHEIAEALDLLEQKKTKKSKLAALLDEMIDIAISGDTKPLDEVIAQLKSQLLAQQSTVPSVEGEDGPGTGEPEDNESGDSESTG